MNYVKKLSFMLLAMIPAAAQASGDICNAWADHGIRNIYQRLTAESATDSVFWKFCDEKYESLTDSKKAEFGVTIKAVPFNFGAETSSDSQKHAKFCGDYKTSTNRMGQEAVYASQLNAKAIDAWTRCVELTQKKEMFIDFRVHANQKIVEIALRHTGPVPAGGKLSFNGVEISGFTCSRDGEEIGPATKFDIDTSVKLIKCERQGVDQDIGGVKSTFYGDAAVTVKTDAGNGSMDFVPMVDGAARGRFEQVDANIAENRQKAADDLKAAIAALQTRLGKWGSTAKSGNLRGSAAIPKGTTQCADGYYVVGVTTWAPETSHCVGCVHGIRVECRPINR